MVKKILINGVTLEGGNLVPLLLKIKNWQNAGCHITFLGSIGLKKQIQLLKMINDYDFILIKNYKNTKNKFHFILEALKKNFLLLFYIKNLKNKFDVIYSISSVLDLIIMPFTLKIIDRKIIWATVFDNTVPLVSNGKIIAGNKIVRILAWIFYKFSLILLKKADCVFVVKPELKKYMLKNGFLDKQLIITGNGVEIDLIKNARVDNRYNIDALFIGRINEAKGIYDMLNVLSIVRKKYHNFQLAIMGKGDDDTENRFKKKIDEMELANNIQFLGYKTGQEKFDIIKSSKIFLFLSETESLPQAPLEAVCSGLKTLVYNLDAYKMYKNNEIIVFEKNDYVSVANKIIKIFKNEDFKNNAGKLLIDKYNWNIISAIELKSFNRE